MLRRRAYVLGVAAIVAMLVMGFLPSLAGAGGVHASAAPPLGHANNLALGAPSRAASHVDAHALPSVAGSGPVSVQATPVALPPSQTLNFTFWFTLNVTNATIDFHNVSITANLTWNATSALVATSTSCSTSATCTANNTQFPLPSAPSGPAWGNGNTSSQELVGFTVTTGWLASMGFNGGNWPQGTYNLTFTFWAWNSSNLAIPRVSTGGSYLFFLQTTVLTVTDLTSAGSQTIPFTFQYELNLTNASIDAANVSITAQIVWMTPGCATSVAFGGSCPVIASVNSCASPCVTNSTQFLLPTAALGPVTAWGTRSADVIISWPITAATLNSTGMFTGNPPAYPQGSYQIDVMVNGYGNSSNALSSMVDGTAPVAPLSTSYATFIMITEPGLTLTSSFALYQALPATLTFNISVTNATPDANNVTLFVEIQYVLSNGATELVANESVPVNGTGTNTSYSVTIDKAYIASDKFAGGQLPTGEYLTTVWLTVTNSMSPSAADWTSVSTGRSVFAYYIINPMTATFLSPTAGSTSPLGNITFSILYQGDFVNGANLTVYSGTTPVFVQGIFNSGTGIKSVVVSWPATGAGTYSAVVTLTAPGQAPGVFTESFNVTGSASGVVTITHNSYSNSTLIPGLTSAEAGALLLIIGLIIGMIVALFLGRMMWGTTRPAAPQQWSPKAANECTICHQTFGTEAELKDHTKTAHGIT